MTKLDDAKKAILDELKAKELVIGAEFDPVAPVPKLMGYKFYRLNIFHKNEDGEANTSAKGVYINPTTGEYYLHSGGTPIKSLVKKVVKPIEPIE